MHNSSQWLEPVLARHLGRVEAPEELWNRVRCPEPPVGYTNRQYSHPQYSHRLAWALATAVLIVLATWGLRPRGDGVNAGTLLANLALAQGSDNLEFRSGEAEKIRAWVKDRTGLDIPFPAESAPSIRLLGAHVVTEGALRVEIAYQTSGHDARLLVSKAASTLAGNGKHRFLSDAPYQGTRVFSWVMRGQLYTLACATPVDSQAACLLCHADAERQPVLN